MERDDQEYKFTYILDPFESKVANLHSYECVEMAVNACPSGSLQSFPLGVAFNLMENTYKKAKNHPLNIEFTWGTRTSAPKFSYAESGEIDHVGNDMETSILYNNTRYNLISLQLAKPTHNSWIIPPTLEVSKLDNKEDIIATYQLDTFSTNGDTDAKYIILVNSILRQNSITTAPTYLMNFANGVSSESSLADVFPYDADIDYVYYVTCIAGNTLTEHYKNVLVIINTEGLLVGSNIMDQIKMNYNKSSLGDYPEYIPVANFSVSSRKSNVSSLEGFATAAVTPGNRGGSRPPPVSTEAAFNSMKCVPFDPERNLTKDGSIVIDTSSGVPFTLNADMSVGQKMNILKLLKNADGTRTFTDAHLTTLTTPEAIDSTYESILPETSRKTAKNQFTLKHTGTIPFTQVEQMFATICGITCIFILVMVFLNVIASISSNSKWYEMAFTVIEFFVFNLGLFIGGFVVGYFTLPSSCPST